MKYEEGAIFKEVRNPKSEERNDLWIRIVGHESEADIEEGETHSKYVYDSVDGDEVEEREISRSASIFEYWVDNDRIEPRDEEDIPEHIEL